MKISDTKCSTCRYGMAMLQENVFQIPTEEDEQELDWDEQEQERFITDVRICSVCYYRPENPIVTVGTIKECNRWTKNDS